MIGEIIAVFVEDDRLVCDVDFKPETEEATLYGLSSQSSYPIAGDEVAVNVSGEENIIVAVFRPHPSGLGVGESWTYGRDADGNIVSSVKHKSDGTVVINDGTEPALKGDAMNTYLTTDFSVSTAFGPSGPATTPIPENVYNRTILI